MLNVDVHEQLIAKITGESARSEFGDISLTPLGQLVRGSAGQVRMTKSEYLIVWLLVRGQGNLITTDELLYFIYEGEGDLPLGNSLDVFICRARRKLERVSRSVEITRFQGIGLYLIDRAQAKGPD